MSDTLDNISIAKIRDLNFAGVKTLGEDLVVTSKIDHLNIFKEPCRINGIAVFLCTSGSVSCNVNLRPYVLTQGDILINFSSSTIQAITDVPFEASAALISNAYLNKLSMDLGQKMKFYIDIRENAIIRLNENDREGICDVINLIYNSVDDEREGNDAVIDGLIQLLGKMIVRSAQTDAKGEGVVRKPIRAEQIFERFMEIVTSYKGTQRNTAFYSNLMGFTPNYLSNMVKLCSGRSAAEWINESTISEAKVMLRYSGLSVQQISTALNFTSQSAFGKFFKQHVGINPNHFRRGWGRTDD